MSEFVYRVRGIERIPAGRERSSWRIVFAPVGSEVDEGLIVSVTSAVFARLDLDAPFTAEDIAALDVVPTS